MSLLLGLGLGLGAIGLGYNIYSNERNRSDYNKQQAVSNELALRQQDFFEHTAYNAVQMRRNDLEQAGLHPSLLAGGQAAQAGHGVGVQSGAHQNKQQSIMEMALFQAALREKLATTAKITEEAKQVRANTLLTEGRNAREAMRLTYDSQYLGIAQNRNQREAEMHGGAVQNLVYQNAINKYGAAEASIHLDQAISKRAMMYLQQEYMSKHHMHMPTADALTQEIDNILSTGVGRDGKELDRSLMSGLKLLRMLLSR